MLPSTKYIFTLQLHQDCPELSLAAIERAISASYPSSHIFVFTDAS